MFNESTEAIKENQWKIEKEAFIHDINAKHRQVTELRLRSVNSSILFLKIHLFFLQDTVHYIPKGTQNTEPEIYRIPQYLLQKPNLTKTSLAAWKTSKKISDITNHLLFPITRHKTWQCAMIQAPYYEVEPMDKDLMRSSRTANSNMTRSEHINQNKNFHKDNHGFLHIISGIHKYLIINRRNWTCHLRPTILIRS